MNTVLEPPPRILSRCGPPVECKMWRGGNDKNHRCKSRQRCGRRASSGGRTHTKSFPGLLKRYRRAPTPHVNLCPPDSSNWRPRTTGPLQGRGTLSCFFRCNPVNVSGSADWGGWLGSSRISVCQLSTPKQRYRRDMIHRDTGTPMTHRWICQKRGGGLPPDV